MSETLGGQQALLKLESMAHSASKLWQHHHNNYASSTRSLWHIIKDVCKTAYMLGRADADYEAGRALDTLDAQRTPCCEKLREALEEIEKLPWVGSQSPYAKIAREALAQPCSCQRTEAWLCKVLSDVEADINEWPSWLRKAAGVCVRSPQRTPASAGSEEEIAREEAAKHYEFGSTATFCESDLASVILAAMRRSRVEPGAEEKCLQCGSTLSEDPHEFGFRDHAFRHPVQPGAEQEDGK